MQVALHFAALNLVSLRFVGECALGHNDTEVALTLIVGGLLLQITQVHGVLFVRVDWYATMLAFSERFRVHVHLTIAQKPLSVFRSIVFDVVWVLSACKETIFRLIWCHSGQLFFLIYRAFIRHQVRLVESALGVIWLFVFLVRAEHERITPIRTSLAYLLFVSRNRPFGFEVLTVRCFWFLWLHIVALGWTENGRFHILCVVKVVRFLSLLHKGNGRLCAYFIFLWL